MPEFIVRAFDEGRVQLDVLSTRLVLSFVLGGVVAGIYALTQRKPPGELVPFASTIMLLTILIAMVTFIIGSDLARAFSLAGALAIIRFRTVVEDTRDTAFVIFAVVVGMGVGTGSAWVPVLGIPVVVIAVFFLGFWDRTVLPAAGDFALSVRIGLGRDPASLFKDVFDRHLTQIRLKATTTARQGAALDLTYVIRLRREEDALAFATELNQVEGVQNVELRQM
jgi:hypothetical protein